MKVEFLNPFLEAAQEVLSSEARLEIQRGELALESDPVRVDEVTVVVSITGQVSGMVIYSLGNATALEIVSRIMGERLTQMNDLVHSGIAELSNVITGRASIKLADAGYQSNISPPTLIVGRETVISTLDIPRVLVPMNTEAGDITAHLALRVLPRMAAGPLPVPAAPGIDEKSGHLIFQDGQ